MERKVIAGLAVAAIALAAVTVLRSQERSKTVSSATSSQTIKLPEPRHDGKLSVEKAILGRRSVRQYRDEALSLADVSQLVWAAQGITAADFFRVAPSAGALYPLEVYIAAGKVNGLEPGIYKYRPRAHELVLVATGDKRPELSEAALGQSPPREAPMVIAITAVYERTAAKYGKRAERYVPMEAGHAAQNVLLQAEALGLSSVPIGAFDDKQVKKVLGCPDDEQPLYLLPVGRPR